MTGGASPSLTETVAGFAAGLSADDIPAAVRDKAKLHLIDTIGCGIAGASSDLARRLFAHLAVEHREGPCPVFGCGVRFGPAAAAFANAVAMNALDFDDCCEFTGTGMGHPGATIVAAAASAAFLRDIGGPDFLAAIVAAYEINNRLVRAMQPSIERFRLVYGVCQHQTVGAAIAFGKLLGSDANALENAIGLAGTLANVPSLHGYNWGRRPLISLKDFNGPAAEAGVRAVQLDAEGFVGSRSVIDGETGLWRMLGSDRFDGRSLLAGLREAWTLDRNSIKPYPCCRWMHAAMAAFEGLLAEHRPSPQAIEEVTVHTSRGLSRNFMDYEPANMVDAQFSLPYAIAALALDLRPRGRWFEPQNLRRPDLLSWARRVTASVDPAVDAAMSGPERRPSGRVGMRWRGGAALSPIVEYPPGSRENPIPEAQIFAKFIENSGPALGADKARRLLDRLLRLEAEPSVAELLSQAAPEAG
jgi:2-methylcitrate dehydratase PrpD